MLLVGDAVGIPGCRVPYIKGGFTVTGLPKDIQVKKPSSYGVDQIKAIMAHQENIVFCLTPKDNSCNAQVTNSIVISEDARKALCKVVDEDRVDEVVAGKAILEESDVEVTDIQLSEYEFQLLTSECKKYFTEDAWKSLNGNFESCRDHEGYVLPVYTESKDPYWLFYFPGKNSELQNLEPGTKISGYWLNLMEQFKYELLYSKNRMSIDAVSIISNSGEENNLFLRQAIALRNKNVIIVPESFHKRVLACLETQGFL
jgi:hypothetical protein